MKKEELNLEPFYYVEPMRIIDDPDESIEAFFKYDKENTEIEKSLISILGSMTYPNLKIEDFQSNNQVAERIKNLYSLEKRKEEYKGLVWASQNPDFDYRTLIPEDDYYKIHFSKDEVYQLLMDTKKFYETNEYELLTDDRKPKEGWEL